MPVDLFDVRSDYDRFFCVKTDKFKVSSLTCLLLVPNTLYQASMSHILMSVLARGTETHRTVGEISRYLDNLYSMNVSTRRCAFSDNFFLGVTAEFIDSKYIKTPEKLEEKAVDFIEELLFHPLLDERGCFKTEYVESEKEDALHSLVAVKNNPRGYASMRCRELLCRDDKIGETKYEDIISEIEGITADSLTDYYRKITGNCNIVAFYVGCRAEEVVSALRKTLSKYKRGRRFPELLPLTRATLPSDVLSESEEFSVSQCKLSVGYRTDIIPSDDDSDVYAMDVFCEMFGGGPYSKLFSDLREKQSLCYYCSASYSKFRGIIMVNSGIDSKNVDVVKDGIDLELQKLKDGDFTEKELMSAKLALKFAYTQIPDSTASLENYYLPRVLTLKKQCFDISYAIDRIMSVTKEDIIRVGKRIKKGAAFTVIGNSSGEEYEEE